MHTVGPQQASCSPHWTLEGLRLPSQSSSCHSTCPGSQGNRSAGPTPLPHVTSATRSHMPTWQKYQHAAPLRHKLGSRAALGPVGNGTYTVLVKDVMDTPSLDLEASHRPQREAKTQALPLTQDTPGSEARPCPSPRRFRKVRPGFARHPGDPGCKALNLLFAKAFAALSSCDPQDT